MGQRPAHHLAFHPVDCHPAGKQLMYLRPEQPHLGTKLVGSSLLKAALSLSLADKVSAYKVPLPTPRRAGYERYLSSFVLPHLHACR